MEVIGTLAGYTPLHPDPGSRGQRITGSRVPDPGSGSATLELVSVLTVFAKAGNNR
jgi:hypothetical protein